MNAARKPLRDDRVEINRQAMGVLLTLHPDIALRVLEAAIELHRMHLVEEVAQPLLRSVLALTPIS